ncbi:hypothetical protein VTJ83DRAFT_1395 [Remersonia thermophila]|uniref:Oxo-4-hydroxy-4-carboxy-5-ureidoimidazoline decarboxylase domain-containing protein n=1 Tax=Remersonia thermophila TaxID=72144 RepID=A0ABR4DS07_9PEZI
MTSTTTTTTTTKTAAPPALPTLPSIPTLRALPASPDRDAALVSALDILFEPSNTLHSLALPSLNADLLGGKGGKGGDDNEDDEAAAAAEQPDGRAAWERELAGYEKLVGLVRAALRAVTAEAGGGDREAREALHDILGSHPRLGRKPVPSAEGGAEPERLSVLSAAEQGHLRGAGSGAEGAAVAATTTTTTTTTEEEEEELARLNAEYEKRFPGLRYVTWVNGRPRSVILADMRERIAKGSLEEEERRGVEAICDIALDRARKLLRAAAEQS